MRSNRVFWHLLIIVFCAISLRADMTAEEMLATPIESRVATIKQHRVAQKIVETLSQWHYDAHSLTPEMICEWYDEYFKDLDPLKVLFTRADYEKFIDRRTKLWNPRTNVVDMEFPFMVYEMYLHRVKERAEYVMQLANADMDYDVKEELNIDRKDADYPATDAERKELWRKYFKNEMILLVIDDENRKAGKNVEDDEDDAGSKVQKTLGENIQTLLKSYARSYKRRTELQGAEIFELYMNALSGLYDPHSNYMAPSARDDFNIQMSLSLQGIGATLSSKDGYTTIVEIVPGGPADRDGRLKKGDKIIAVAQDGKEAVDVIEMPLNKVVQQIRGPKGTKVHLTILSEGERASKIITIVRDVVELKDSEAKSSLETIKCSDGRTATVLVMHLPSFYCDFNARQRGDPNYKSTTRDMIALLKKGAGNGGHIDGVILDLRYNGGGSLDEAISLAGIFNHGTTPVVQIRNSNGKVEERKDNEDICYFDGPVVVLTDRTSASASEIVAAALQDMGRAVIVGESMTHGKGTVQNVIDMSSLMFPRNLFSSRESLGALKITTAKFYRINGGSTQEKGVVPDILLPALSDAMELGENKLPHCLPWDEIKPMQFQRQTALDALKPLLADLSKQRIAKSPEFMQIKADIAEYDAISKLKVVPLDIDRRRALEEKQEHARKILKNYYNSNSNATDAKKLKNPPKDIVLQEALNIMADMCSSVVYQK